jgi:mono/diheme cytochrome c family protein
MLPILIVAITQMLALSARPALAEALDGRALVSERCASCHDLSGPAWLVAWLQNPTVIRRAGVIFLNHVLNEAGKDRIAEDTVKPCPANLSPAQAETVADYLMTLEDSAMKTGIVDIGKKFRKQKGFRLFTKQLPCIGCHRIKFGKRKMGGVSGPDLTDAGVRLNPNWIYARIENPQYWDPKTWMPGIEMSHRKREMLTLFVSSMK